MTTVTKGMYASRIFPIDFARSLSAGLALAIGNVHSRGYVHGDLHLRNVLVRLPKALDALPIEEFYREYGEPETVPISRTDGAGLPPDVPAKAVIPLYLGKYAEEFSLADCRVLLSDFGESFSPSTQSCLGEDCHAPITARLPEAHFEPKSPLSQLADIWSLAMAIWGILGMKAIFSSEFATDNEVISQRIEVLGPLPQTWWKRWENRSAFFTEDRRPTPGPSVWPPMEQAFEEGIQKWRRKLKRTEYGPEESKAMLELLQQMLKFEPDKRPTIQDVLKSEWMVNWALPEFERTLALPR